MPYLGKQSPFGQRSVYKKLNQMHFKLETSTFYYQLMHSLETHNTAKPLLQSNIIIDLNSDITKSVISLFINSVLILLK